MSSNNPTIARERLPPELEKLLHDYQSGYLRESELVGAIKATAKHEAGKTYNRLGEAVLVAFLLIGAVALKVNVMPSPASTNSPTTTTTADEVVAIPSTLDPVKIISTMERKGFVIRRGIGELNVIYIFNPNFQATINQWSDRRLLITFKNNQPVIVHAVPATIKGGEPSWNNPPNPKGYPVIVPGQYDSWAVGYHKGRRALAQVGSIPVSRTKDQGKTWNPDQGLFGINQHRGGGATVRNWSEGCLVSQSGHEDFMKIIYTDPGYILNKNFRFHTAIISSADLN